MDDFEQNPLLGTVDKDDQRHSDRPHFSHQQIQGNCALGMWNIRAKRTNEDIWEKRSYCALSRHFPMDLISVHMFEAISIHLRVV